jgi:hypothetical protein
MNPDNCNCNCKDDILKIYNKMKKIEKNIMEFKEQLKNLDIKFTSEIQKITYDSVDEYFK